MYITCLSAKEYFNDIILSGRIDNNTIFIRLMDIEHYILIAKLPGMSDEKFEEFLDDNLDKDKFRYA